MAPFFISNVLISLISPQFESSIKVFGLCRKSQAVDFPEFFIQSSVCGVSVGNTHDDYARIALFVF
jgi:hypothetical protein